MKCSTASATILALSGVALAFPQPGLLDDVQEGCDPSDPLCQEAGPFLTHLVDSSKQFAELTQQDGLTDDDTLSSAKYQLPIHSSGEYDDDDMYDDLPLDASATVPKTGGIPSKVNDKDNLYDDDLYNDEYDDLYGKEVPGKESFKMPSKGLHRRAIDADSTVAPSVDESVDGAVDTTGVDQAPELAVDYQDGDGVQYWDGSDNSTEAANALTIDPVDETLSFNASLTTSDSLNSTDAILINSNATSAASAQRDGASGLHFGIVTPLCSIVLASVGAIFLL